MKTDELIDLLAADAGPARLGHARRRILLALGAGVLIAAALVLCLPQPTMDVGRALRTSAFWMKLAYGGLIGVGGYLLTDKAARPGARGRGGWLLVALALVAIMGLAALEMAAMPRGLWMQTWIGRSAIICPLAILVVSAPVFVGGLWAVRGLAPTRLALAGAAVGLVAGGLGIMVYALWCRETAPLFVATWYTLGVAICAGLGAAIGPKVLRW
jgi:hypothetical protein